MRPPIEPVTQLRSSWLSGLFLMLVVGVAGFLVLILGIIYSIWRMTKRYRGCSLCRSTRLIPTETPVGRELLQRFARTAENHSAP